jgi:hypothetical protein
LAGGARTSAPPGRASGLALALGICNLFNYVVQLVLSREQPAIPFADEESGSLLMPPGPSVFYGYTAQVQYINT